MPAKTPIECGDMLLDALNRGDVEAAVALYEPDALFISGGNSVQGHAAIRETFAGFAALEAEFSAERRAMHVTGDIAMALSTWKCEGVDADGNRVEFGGDSVDVIRRQPDGTWLFAIDNATTE
ncbi:YybH family protein [Paraliomyxa miuraensis]|uniref:YybH family protein n=1 Tax=Paraliomyxa miuraensis TaxID=376150 RepID=UPI00224DC756|nr:SgcJ/EcaC family oxidoreductase [Paraliomyxa miuraensis]MCX4243974.1 SgcJ/EcaC family oxidoreductase [Paraliomyxa miuraensis]